MRMWRCTALGCLAGLAQAAAQGASTVELPSCVAGSPPMTVAADAARTTLDSADRQWFDAAARARYPLYEQGGHWPAEVWLLQRGTRWVYVTTWPQGVHGSCFTAVFAADRFDFTGRWLAKYQPRRHAVDDE